MSTHSKLLTFCIIFLSGFSNAQTEKNCITESLEFAAINDAKCLNEIGNELLLRGRVEKATKAFEKALSVSQDLNNQITAHNQLAVAYKNLGSEQQATNYITRALSEAEKSGDTTLLAATYNNYGLVMTNIDNDIALDNYLKALELYQSLYHTEHISIIQSLINIGIIYRNIEFYGDAINNFQQAKDIAEKLFTSAHPTKGFIQYNLGQTNFELNNTEAAVEFFKNSLAEYKKVYGEKHPDIARAYNRLGNVVNQKGEFEEALAYYQKALIANSRSFSNEELEFNPKVSEHLNANTLLNSLFYKAQAFEDYHFNFSLDFKDLKKSLTTLYSADSLIDEMRKTTSNESDKIAIGALASQVYENGVRLSYSMADLGFKKDEYYEHAFYFTEKSKSAVLLQSISDASAKSFANIPPEEIAKENYFQSEITYYEQQLVNQDVENSQEFTAKLLKLRREYDEFVTSLEKEYPEYYNLKYNVEIPSMEKIQAKLKEDEALISYFMSDTRLYVFLITQKKTKVDRVNKPENFDRYLSGFRNSIYFKEDDVYKLTATELYDNLFPNSVPRSITHLIIVPAGALGTMPFEALLTDKVKEDNLNFKSLPYLVNDYSISYQYASALYYQKTDNKMSQLEPSALLCAPVKFQSLEDLPGTEKEIDELKNIFVNQGFQPDILVQGEATEASFKNKDLNNYKYLHLATHGTVNEYSPALSRIFLYEETDQDEDGSLYSGEIYNLKLNADLVTLSACETGLGQISKGEGIIGLSRALIYAGAQNLIVSLWKVADESTSKLMTDFYSDLDNSQYYSALREAKIKMIDSENAHPYLWAPFVLIGN